MKAIPFRWLIEPPRLDLEIERPPYMRLGAIYFVIEGEIERHAKYVENEISKRTQKLYEAKNGEQGILGQEIFLASLIQLKVPNLYAFPILGEKYDKAGVYRMIEGKHYDFYIPGLAQNKRFISVKTTPKGKSKVRLLVTKDPWENERHDIIVAIKIVSFVEARIYGWLYANEVQTLPFCRHVCKKPCYWTYLDPETVKQNLDRETEYVASPKLKPLRSPWPLLKELMQISIDPKIRDNASKISFVSLYLTRRDKKKR